MPVSIRPPVAFATSNPGKAVEAKIVLDAFGIELVTFSGKGIEIQADSVVEVAEYSARSAASRYGRALIVEDAGLFVTALKGFPGPFSSYVFKTLGSEGVLKLLDGVEDRTATFKSAVAYCEPSGESRTFEGMVGGRLALSPSGERGFGFDPVFLPDGGGGRSMGELTVEEKCLLSHRGNALRSFARWYVDR
jgi:XTP/dITP diphosphohydrolase